jgi:adenosylcobinamide-GDP ribazoletransferase
MSTTAGLRRAARDALCFLTPLGRSPEAPGPESMVFFPLLGAGLGVANGLAWRAGRRRTSPLLAAVLTTLTDVVGSGALHLDGLADAADGLLAHVPAKSRLEIMAEPQIGTYGALALGGALALKAAALSALEPSPALLAALWCCSRSVMVLGSRALPYARAEGLASAFVPKPGAPRDPALLAGVLGVAGALVLGSAGAGRRGVVAVLAGGLSGAGVLELARRRIGGFTGDVLGASGVVCESFGLAAAALS